MKNFLLSIKFFLTLIYNKLVQVEVTEQPQLGDYIEFEHELEPYFNKGDIGEIIKFETIYIEGHPIFQIVVGCYNPELCKVLRTKMPGVWLKDNVVPVSIPFSALAAKAVKLIQVDTVDIESRLKS